MHPDTYYLKTFAEEIAKTTTGNFTSELNHRLEAEADKLEKSIAISLLSIENATQRDTFYFNTITHIVRICDILFNINQSINPSVTIVLNLLENVRQILPNELRPNLKLAKAFIVVQRPIFAAAWEKHRQEMEQLQIDPELVTIASIPFARFHLGHHKLYWGDYTWLKSYLSKFDMMDWSHNDCGSKTEALMSLMIGREFNDDRFYVYCKRYVSKRIIPMTGKRPRITELVACEKLVLQDTQVGVPLFDHHANRVSTRLIKWIKEEIDFVETHEREQPFEKLAFQFYQYTLAFFFKLLHEQKVFGDISFRELSKQVASTCTAMGSDIPPEAMVKKAYLKKKVDFKRMEALLLAMLEYLRRFM